MGIKLKELVSAREINLEELNGKVLAVDAFNMLYQFLTTIRQRDGSLLFDSKGNVTSHLNGLFYRCTKFIENGMKLAFVFDGKAPAIKKEEVRRRAERKEEAMQKYEAAMRKGDVEQMRKYASRTAILTVQMVEESKMLLDALGVPFIDAPSEGEAQAAYMTKKDAFAVVSQDFDSLLFGSKRLVRNLSIEGRRKVSGKLQFTYVEPEIIELEQVLNSLGINHEQLVVAGILIGTDYNPGGINGIGPKKALHLVKQEKDFDKIFEKVNWRKYFEIDWKEIFDTITKMPVVRDYKLKWGKVDVSKVRELLVEGHDFDDDRIDERLRKFVKLAEEKKQAGLGKWV